jgi:NUDIX domain.
LPEHVEIIASTVDWLRYWIPKRFLRYNMLPLCIGQKQIWYLLKLVADEGQVKLNCSKQPEFDTWCWIDYWDPLQQVVAFKRNVYETALKQFAPHLFPDLS